MKESAKRLWGARLLALVVMSVSISVFISMAPENTRGYKKRVTIRAGGDVGQIVTAVEELDRDDIQIKTSDESWFASRPGFLAAAPGMFVAFGIILAIYHTIYCVINALLGLMKEPDDSQRETRLTDFIQPPP